MNVKLGIEHSLPGWTRYLFFWQVCRYI